MAFAVHGPFFSNSEKDEEVISDELVRLKILTKDCTFYKSFTTISLRMELLQSHILAIKYKARAHSNTIEMDSFDKFYFNKLKQLSILQLGNILYQSICANRARAELINNKYYHGVNDKSFLVGYKGEKVCGIVIFETRHFNENGSCFNGTAYFSCVATQHKQISFYNIDINKEDSIWHSPEVR